MTTTTTDPLNASAHEHRRRRSQHVLMVMLGIGLVLTIAAAITPFVDHMTSDTLTRHIQAGYPDYPAERVRTADTIYLTYLAVLGGLGVLGWLVSLRAVARRASWARLWVSTIFVVAAIIAVTDLLIKDTSGQTGLSSLVGWVGVVPCLAGLVSVVLVWRQPPVAARYGHRVGGGFAS